MAPANYAKRATRGPQISKHMREATIINIEKYNLPAFCNTCEETPAETFHQRLKDMKSLTKDPNAAARQRAAEEKANENAALKSVSMPLSGLGASGAVGGKKKPVFKSTLQPQNAALAPKTLGQVDLLGTRTEDWNGAVANGWNNDVYDPEMVTEYADVKIGDLVEEFGDARGGRMGLR